MCRRPSIVVSMIPIAIIASNANSQVEQAKLVASDNAAADQFGISIAIDGDTAIVGAYLDDNEAGSNAGSAYVFVRSGGVWSEQQKLIGSQTVASNRMGLSVTIQGDTAAVGNFQKVLPGGLLNAGEAYVFVRSGGVWTEQARLIASDPGNGDTFGTAASISGETLVIGASRDTISGAALAGSAYVFVRSGTTWTQQSKLTASDFAAGDAFGINASLDGNTLIVGAMLDDTAAGADAGSAYIFTRSGSVWTQSQKLTAFDAQANDWFGSSVSLRGNTAVVGARQDDNVGGTDAGSAYVYVRTGGTWTLQEKLTASGGAAGDGFGSSVAIDGDSVVVGAFQDDHIGGVDAGSAYYFTRTDGSWTQVSNMFASDAAAGDAFGYCAAISSNTAVFGSYLDDQPGTADAGSASVFLLDADGACCMPQGNCLIKTSSECASAGGTFTSIGTTCPDACGSEPDIDGDGLPNGLDIRCMVRCLVGPQDPSCNCAFADIDGNGSSNTNDIEPFVNFLLNH